MEDKCGDLEKRRFAPAVEEKESVALYDDNSERVTYLGASLSPAEKIEFINCLKNNADVFAWSFADMPGIDAEVACHELNIIPGSRPVTQKLRKISPEVATEVQKEVEKLLLAGFIREAKYPKWVANIVAVRKKTGKIRVCIDYVALNKSCPKDSYPLPRIDKLVDSTSGNALLSMMDGYSGYNQIPMKESDQENTAFITDKGLYCYTVMPFGLKNAGATYQRMANKIFGDLVGDSVEVYVDDILVKSKDRSSHVLKLEAAFSKLREFNLKLNPEKCIFGVSAGKFLGFLVTQRGIEANPEQIKAILNLQPPRNIKEVQALTGRAAALRRFISRLSDRCHPFFKLHKAAKFEWTKECDDSFNDLKEYLNKMPVMSAPHPESNLILYLSITDVAMGAALMTLKGSVESPVYFVSHMFNEVELRYLFLERVVCGLYRAAEKLRPYLQSHSVTLKSEYPIQSLLEHPEATGRVARWALKLQEYGLKLEPRTSEKGHSLAGLLTDLGQSEKSVIKPEEEYRQLWKVFVDGSKGNRGAGVGIHLISPAGVKFNRSIRLLFPTTNNEAEYEAVAAGLLMAKEKKVRDVEVISDSLLITNQISGVFGIKEERLRPYQEWCIEMIKQFDTCTISHIPRLENRYTDALALVASTLVQDGEGAIEVKPQL